MKNNAEKLTAEQKIIAQLSNRLIELQREIRILNKIKWGDDVKKAFFDKKCKVLPDVDANYYTRNVDNYNFETKRNEFREFDLEIQNQLGKYSPLSQLLRRMCDEYVDVLEMLKSVGTKRFGSLSKELYGSSTDAFYVGGPNLTQLATSLDKTLPELLHQTENELDEKKYTSEETVERVREELGKYFNDPNEQVTVELSESIIADAAAGAEAIKIRENTLFSERDIRVLIVHEGWIHLATTLNGRRQPICTFLSKGTPSSTVTQEGLALLTEVFTFSAYPGRIKRMCNRITAVNLVEQGADFIQVYNHLKDHGLTEDESYQQAVRVFRGSLPDGSCGAFTKDVSYTKGFVFIYNYLHLVIKHGLLDQIPLLFVGKTTLQDLPVINDLVEQGLVTLPKYMPPQFRDLAALSCWMSFSLFMNEIDLDQMELDFKAILRI